jgi:glycosyltransferase involved in cell wall biosynthesis
MKLAFVTTWDPHDAGIWAGTGYHIARALEAQGCRLEYFGPLRERFALPFKVAQLAYQKLRRQALQRDREPMIVKAFAQQIDERLARSDADAVFCVGSIAVPYLRTTLPVVAWADATYAGLIDAYRYELPPTPRSRRLGLMHEAMAMRRLDLAIFSSDWAAQSALSNYRTDPAKVKVVPFGANIDSHRTAEDVERSIAARPTDRCRLLFIGTGWHRKGGDVAVEVARRLNESGLLTELTLLGGDLPEAASLPAFVKPVGFIDKKSPDGQRRFDELVGGSHFLILPARAEAFGVVLCEAGSYGVPALATNVHGIPTIIRDGVNGLLFEPDSDAASAGGLQPACNPERSARPEHGTGGLKPASRARDIEAIVDAVRALIVDPARYRALARSSFAEYQARLNWDVAGRTVKQILDDLILSRR